MSTNESLITAFDGLDLSARSAEIIQYLHERNQRLKFKMIEIGHGGTPVAAQQPVPFLGRRSFVGTESWLRATKEVDEPAALQKKLSGENITFLNYRPDGSLKSYQGFRPLGDHSDDGSNLAIILAEHSADEILLSNVFGDPKVFKQPGASEDLLAKAAKLADYGGTIVIRETISAQTACLTPAMLMAAGLEATAMVKLGHESWQDLEAVYRAPDSLSYIGSESLYLFAAPSI